GASSAFSGCGRIGMPPAAVGSYAADWENVPQGGELRPHGGTLVNGRGFPVNHHKLEAGNIEGAKLGSCCFTGIGLMRRSPSPAISGPDHTKGSHLRRRPTRRPSFGEWSVLIATLALLALTAFSGFE